MLIQEFSAHITAFSLWNALKKSFEGKEATEGLKFEMKLKELKMKNGDPLSFIKALEKYVSILANLKRGLTEEQKLDYLFKGRNEIFFISSYDI